MPDEPEMMQQLGAFEPHEATRLLPRLETQGIRFELKRDDTALAVFVPVSQLDQATAALKELFPV